jgi:transcriptional regulator with GAF, ATPase, and Fis domain
MSREPVLKTVFVAGRPTARHLRKGRLVVVDGPMAGKSVDIERQRVRVGRSVVNDLAIDDTSVSGTHVEIRSTEDGIVLLDMGSTNGTWAGDVRLQKGLLTRGASFRVGNTTLRYESLDDVVEIPLHGEDHFGGVLGSSVPMREIFATLARVAPSDLTVLIEGETGTGKEVVARAIHDTSGRAKGPFVVLDCSAIAKNLSESELFGHEEGAFTGAVGRHQGAFERADGGTIFLDEIGELPQELQPKLLRVLENRELRRVGGTKTIRIDVRLLAATNRDLRAMVADGGFREDLFFRLSVIHAGLPPLRDRADDIPLLLDHFLRQLRNPRFGGQTFTVSGEGVTRLKAHAWPGNIRELRNVIERAVSLADGTHLGPDDLFFDKSRSMPASAAAGAPIYLERAFKEAKQEVVDGWEARYLKALFEAHGGNISAGARASGLTRFHLRELLKKHGLSGAGGKAHSEGDS